MNERNLYRIALGAIGKVEDPAPPKQAPVVRPKTLMLVPRRDAEEVALAKTEDEESEERKVLDRLRGQLAALDNQQRVGGREVALLLVLGAAGYGLTRMAGAAWAGRAVGMDGHRKRGRR